MNAAFEVPAEFQPDKRLSLDEIFRDRKEYNEFQATKLMPLAYSLRHPQEPLPENRNIVAMEWITEEDAQKVEEYMRLHPNEKIDTSDESQVKAFLFRVDPRLQEIPPTLH